MCGICGTFGCIKTHSDSILSASLHRGPDGKTIITYPWGSLGFCRLDIFGPSGVNQPVFCSDRKTALVFNGEIYNFQELIREHSVQNKIANEADLILKLYLSYGESCFQKLKGMFAIAILTPHRLILVRDALGIKPLLYCVQDGALYFSSEIKALLQLWNKSVEIDLDALAEAAVFGFVFDLEKTMFKGVSQVPPGAYLVFENKKLRITKYYKIPQSYYIGESAASENLSLTFQDLLSNTAARHVEHSKHPQGIYLSGGIDSTLMTMFLQNNSNKCLDTFTLFDDPESEDRIFASRVASALKTNHHEFKTNSTECIKFLDHYLYHYESLVTDGIFNVLGSLAFHILSYYISKTHKVAYCGEGADELFGGYYWMHSHPLGLGDRLRARSLAVNNGNTRIHEYIMKKFPDDDSKESDMRREIFDFLIGPGLANCHLWSVDRSSSAFSFEARPLYLYDDIREWALSLPIENKVSQNKDTKLILKQYAQMPGNDWLKTIAGRKKIGMPAALNLSLNKLISHSENEFRSSKTNNNLFNKEYSAYLKTDLEKLMFDKFYELFVINRGKKVPDLEEMPGAE